MLYDMSVGFGAGEGQFKVGQQVSISIARSHACHVEDTSDPIAGDGFSVTSAIIGFVFSPLKDENNKVLPLQHCVLSIILCPFSL